jgi:ATP-dependent Clp protease ATP-binding subunit ClpC
MRLLGRASDRVHYRADVVALAEGVECGKCHAHLSPQRADDQLTPPRGPDGGEEVGVLPGVDARPVDIFNILLQILDDGRLTDAQGRTVDFKNAVVIMTSNLGADRIQQYARQGGDFDELRDELMEALRQNFRPEFINRIDDIIVFRALDDVQLAEITKLLLDKLVRRMRAQRIEVEFTDDAVQLLAREGYDPEFGARPLRRTIQRLVENELSRMVLDESVKEGDKIVVEAEGDELRFEVESGAAELEPAEQEEAVPTA